MDEFGPVRGVLWLFLGDPSLRTPQFFMVAYRPLFVFVLPVYIIEFLVESYPTKSYSGFQIKFSETLTKT